MTARPGYDIMRSWGGGRSGGLEVTMDGTIRVTRRTVRQAERIGVETRDGERFAIKLRGWGMVQIQGYRIETGEYVEIPTASVAHAVSFDR